MDIQEKIVNKVALSGLVSYDLETIKPQGERILYDIKDNLFHGLMLKEKDFREFIKNHDWTQYEGKHVAITCSTDAIVPTWAYMLLTTKFSEYALTVIFGSLEDLEDHLLTQAIENLDVEQFKDQKIVVKGCGDGNVPVSAFVALTAKLKPVVKSLMYGEPCSTVPLYKRKD